MKRVVTNGGDDLTEYNEEYNIMQQAAQRVGPLAKDFSVGYVKKGAFQWT
jgi:hypothetical protein